MLPAEAPERALSASPSLLGATSPEACGHSGCPPAFSLILRPFAVSQKRTLVVGLGPTRLTQDSFTSGPLITPAKTLLPNNATLIGWGEDVDITSLGP